MALPSSNTINFLNTPNRSGSYFPNDGFLDALLRKIIFQPMESTYRFSFSRGTTLPVVEFFERDDTLPIKPTEVASATDTLFRLGDHTCLDHFDQIGSNRTDQIEEQVKGIKLGILRQLSARLILGTTLGGNLGGLNWQVTSGHGVLINSTATAFLPFLQEFYKARYSSKAVDGLVGGLGGVYFVGNTSALRLVLACFDGVGKSARWRYDEELKVNLLHLCGLPFLLNNSIPNDVVNEETVTSIYVLQLRGPTAIRILYAKDPFHPCDSFGIHCYSIPLQGDKDNFYQSVVGFYQVHVPEDNIIVRLKDVIVTKYT